MSLPKIEHATFSFMTWNSKVVKIRSMLAKEEKILLIAKESDDIADVYNAILQVCNNCIVDPEWSAHELSMFDLDLLFLKIRALSVSNTVKVSLTDEEDEKQYDFEIDLNEIKLSEFSIPESIIIDKNTYLTLRYPTAKLYGDRLFVKADQHVMLDKLIDECIAQIVATGKEKKSYEYQEASANERQQFMDELPIKTREAIIGFINTIPSLYYKISYENSKGTKREIELKTLSDFFTFR